MNADERVESLTQEHLSDVHGGSLSIVGEDNPFFRSIRKTANNVDVTVLDGFHATTPVLLDAKSDKEYVLTKDNDIDHLVTDGMSCVAEATLDLLQTYGLSGKHVVIIGRGHAVKGLATAMLANDATVTVCHSKTRFLSCIMHNADMLVVAAPVKESFRPRFTSVVVDISNAFADREDTLKATCEYTRHIGKLTVAILLERAARKNE